MLFIYKRLKKDFEFVENYGFHHAYQLKSNIAPGIFYRKEEESLSVGFDYVEGKFYCLYNPNGSVQYYEPLEKCEFNDHSYNRQVSRVKEIINIFLKGL